MRAWTLIPVAIAAHACAPPTPTTTAESWAPPGVVAPAFDHAPPYAGGTLTVSRDRRSAVVSDPDRDRLWLLDLRALRIAGVAELEPGDEPGRAVEDFGERFHVALRRGGAIVTVEKDGERVMRRVTCPSPRGLALAEDGDHLHVACAGGELVTYGVLDHVPSRTLHLDADLRDVVVSHGALHVSRFRAAEVLRVSAAGAVTARQRPLPLDVDAIEARAPRVRFVAVEGFEQVRAEAVPRRRHVLPRVYDPGVAWRLAKDPATDELVLLHQRGARFPVDMDAAPEALETAGYGSTTPPQPLASCPPKLAHGAVTRFPLDGAPPSEHALPIFAHAVPVDLAISPDGARVAVAYPGRGDRVVEVVDRAATDVLGCPFATFEPGRGADALAYEDPTGVAWIDDGALAVHYRRPSAVVIYDGPGLSRARAIRLGGSPEGHIGRALFHEETESRLACATCHPEGGDDGRVWDLGGFGGTRRTQSLHGDVTESAPFHWSGDLETLDALIDEVHGRRMGGRPLGRAHRDALTRFLAGVPEAPRAIASNRAEIAHGRRAFVEAGCAACHSGPRLTDGRSWDVGTGEVLQTPSLLGLRVRAPYLHDGRAPTLRARFEEGHTRGHGELDRLSPADIDAMVAYLESL